MNNIKNYVLSILLITWGLGQAQVTITGKVYNASKDSMGVKNSDIHLLQMKSGQMMPQNLDTRRSNAAGSFRFLIADPDTSVTYLAAVDHEGVRYYSHGARISLNEKTAKQDIVVYDSTNQADNVHALMHHLFIDDLGGTLNIRETRIIFNPGKFAVLNAINDSLGQSANLRFRMPFLAQNFTPLAPMAGAELSGRGHFVYDRGILTPGTRQVSYSYQIPWTKNRALFTFYIDHPTRSFDVFTSDRNLAIQSKELQNHGAFPIRGVNYQRFGAGGLPTGSEISFDISRKTAPVRQTPTSTILLTAVLLTIGLIIANVRKPKAPAKKGSRS